MNDKVQISKRIIVYEEIFDSNVEISDKDVEEYSKRLGIDLTVNPALTSSVKDWILQPLPRYWFPCLDTHTGLWFYSNTLNGQSTWTHPLEEIHRNLAKEYCTSQTITGIERENPEGESAEQSMESGFSTKGFGSLSSSPAGGIPSTSNRNQLPRALAPLKRIPKVEPLGTLKAQVNPLPPFSVASPLHNEYVRDVSFSTFKSVDPIPSLLPNDILFENRDRPTANLAPYNQSVLSSTAESLRSKIIARDDDTFLSSDDIANIPRHSLDGKKTIASLTVDSKSVKDIPANASTVVEATYTTTQESKPAARISFTERLAAKKASRSKSNESLDTILGNANESDQTPPSATIVEKKQVKFDLESKQICQYTPECSEEIKAADKSESSSSEDILDLVGDPEFLKPLSDLNCYPTAFEERRWNVSFTSFGVNPAIKSPDGISPRLVDSDDSHEMVTRFNSEYCPSPLPACTTTASPVTFNEDHITPEPSKTQEEDKNPDREIKVNSIANELPMIETNVSTFNENAQNQLTETQAFFVAFYDNNENIENESSIPKEEQTSKEEAENPHPFFEYDQAKEEVGESSSSSNSIPEPVIEMVFQPSNSTLKSQIPKLTRSCSTRSESFEDVVTSPQPAEQLNVPDLPSALNLVESTDFTDWIDPQVDSVESDIALSMKPVASHFNLLLPPAHFSQNDTISQPVITTMAQTEEEKMEVLPKDDKIDVRANTERQPIATASQEDFVKIKKEMEVTLENEKKKLENWFTSEIAQIKKQFEVELANERQRTENLSRLVESAKSEKEELARREIIRLEETLSHLVEEKTRQVQTRLNSEILQCNPFLNRSVDRQDANIQTEEEPVIPVKSVQQKRSSLDESGTSEPNHERMESRSQRESRESRKKSPQIKCQCESLQKQVARVEREMQLLKQKNLSFQKNPPTRKKSTPVKAQREDWWPDTDESTTSTASSIHDWRYSKGRSRSMTNLHEARDRTAPSKKSNPVQRARDLLAKSQTPRRAWMEDLSTDSSGDTPTSGISSAISTGEWDTVLSSIQKISGDLQEVWSHIGPRPKPLSYLSHTSSVWMPTTSSYSSDRVPLHWSFTGSTAERTQALRLWLQQNRTQHSGKPFL